MSSTSMDEQSASPADSRQNFRSPLIVQKVLIDYQRPVFFGYSKNLSRSGLFVATTNPTKAGEQLDLEIPLPEELGGTIRCRCEVVWRRPLGSHLPFEPGMGLKFVDLPEELSKRIDDWVLKQKKD